MNENKLKFLNLIKDFDQLYLDIIEEVKEYFTFDHGIDWGLGEFREPNFIGFDDNNSGDLSTLCFEIDYYDHSWKNSSLPWVSIPIEWFFNPEYQEKLKDIKLQKTIEKMKKVEVEQKEKEEYNSESAVQKREYELFLTLKAKYEK